MGPFHYFHESTLPRLHHIVWCRLPDADGNPGASVRPALVRGSRRHPPTKRGALLLSCGTTRLNSNKCGQTDLIIQNSQRLYELDLSIAVRFDLGSTIWLPWAAEFFQPPEHSLYIVAGPLTDAEMGRLRQRLQRRGLIQAL